MSEESNVTFVAGKAVEQTESLDSNVPQEQRDAAKDAVRKAIEAAGKEAAEEAPKAAKDPFKPPGAKKPVERGEDGKFRPTDKSAEEPKEEDTVDPDKAGLRDLLKKREKIAKKESEFQKAMSEERAKFQAQQKELQDFQWQLKQQMADLEKEKAKFQRFRTNPAEAVRDAGYDPEQFILDLARDGTPEGQMAKQQRELQQQLQEIRDWKEQQAKQAEESKRQQEFYQMQQYRGHVEKQFLGHAMNQETAPLTSMFFKSHPAALIAYGDQIAAEFRELSGGREADIPEIAAYIEEELAQGVKSWYEKNHGTKQSVGSKEEKAPPGKRKGQTLSPDMASERRALSKTLKDLDGEERLLAAKQAVGVALAASDHDQ